MSGIGAITRAQLHVGTPALRSLVDDVAARASARLHVDVFRIGDEAVVGRLLGRADDGVAVSVLADADASVGSVADRLRAGVAEWFDIGRDPFKQHGKSMSRDAGAEGIIATDIADDDAVRRIELALHVEGEPARALAALHDARGPAAIRDALDAAAGLGIVANDPRVGRLDATAAIEQLVRDSDGPLRIMTKAFDDDALTRLLVERARTGQVQLLAHDIPKAQRKLLERAGVLVMRVDEADAEAAGTALHGTLVSTNGRALLGSPYLESRVLRGSDGRQSREVAAVVAGDVATQAAAAWDELVRVNRAFTR
jgi:hypothetical protein